MSVMRVDINELKEGSYVVIDGEPCRVVEVSKAKTGKHGSAKVNIVAISIFTGSKKTLMAPSGTPVEVPVIEKRVGQVLSIRQNVVQIMDLETYETFEIDTPQEQEILNKLAPGVNVEYWIIMGRRKIVRVT
ncbi:MAG: translation initiation factor IF-5A [Sulfolobaceae archaeon]